MIKLYLQKQDDGNILLGDEFFDIPLYSERDWDIISEDEPQTEIQIIKSEFYSEEKSYNVNIIREITLDYCQKSGRRISFLPPLRSHILFCWALPLDFNIKQFYQMITRYNDNIKFIRFIYNTNPDTNQIPYSYSVILYFKGQVAADNFYQEFNCEVIGPKGETLYLLFVSKVHFLPKSFEKCLQEEQIITLDGCVELPKCPICLERLDESVTGISFEMMKKEVGYDDEDRWKKARAACHACQKIKKFSSIKRSNSPGLEKKNPGSIEEIKMDDKSEHIHHKKTGYGVCETCGEDPLSWVCLICGHVGCGRYSSGHAREHSIASRHAFCLELETLRVWDYLQDMYVHRIVRSKEHIMLSLPDTGESANGVNEKIYRERSDQITWEYNYLLGTQLEEQRRYYEEKLASLKRDKEESPRMKQNEETIKRLRIENEEIKKKTEEYEKENKMFVKKIKMVKDKISSLQPEIEQLKVFNQSIEENLKHFNNEEKVVHQSSPEVERERAKLKLLQEKLENLFSKLDE